MNSLKKMKSFCMNCNDCGERSSPHLCYLFDSSADVSSYFKDEHYLLPVETPTDIQELDGIVSNNLLRRPTLICGDAGKSLLAMEFLARGVIEHDEPGVFVTFEASTENLILNSTWLGFDYDDLIERKKISVDFVSDITVNGEFNLEDLFIRLGCAIHNIGAKRVVLDTIESLFSGYSNLIVLRAELRRLFEWLKNKGMTVIITGNRDNKTLVRQGLEEYVSDSVITV